MFLFPLCPQPQTPEKKKSYKEIREEQRLREEAERRPSLIVPDEVKNEMNYFSVSLFDVNEGSFLHSVYAYIYYIAVNF